MRRIVKQLRHGQITIPKDLREAIGMDAGDLLSIDLVNGKLEIQPVKVAPKEKGSPWARELYELFAPVRESLEGRSEEEIDAAVGEAVEEVRARQR